MRIAMSLLVLSLAIGPAACKKKPAETGAGSSEMGSGSAMAGSNEMGSAGSNEMGSGSAMAGSAGSNEMGSGSAAMEGSGEGSAAAMAHKAGNCPSTVFGSTSTAEVKGKMVVLTITATTPDEVKAIQKRTDELLKHPSPAATPSDEHNQKGAHGGSMGLCPLHVPEGATAKARHEKNGVMVTITPKDNPEGFKADLDARIARAKQWTETNVKSEKGDMGGTGGGKGEHGSNHSGQGDSHGKERKSGGTGGGAGTGGGGGKGTGGGK